MNIDNLVHKAAMIATKCAMNGIPLRSIRWVPPETPASDPEGNWIIVECGPLSGGEQAPWDM